ncbi:uncharacterized protein B0H18DRAFT_958140 [Fomitopsis serialis]|uniref:uncharacterized protein n=1 Tax=Fomitopsis serialis TaxID=139415 RepID=UPI002008AC9E|nr:uncharacterized protein B0H18DRAFT_958140 [Neoantrodia serialis]KAH9917941.1 hypothetical protein B0H18DRAFT_958140 [Neoantrodia serialis]
MSFLAGGCRGHDRGLQRVRDGPKKFLYRHGDGGQEERGKGLDAQASWIFKGVPASDNAMMGYQARHRDSISACTLRPEGATSLIAPVRSLGPHCASHRTVLVKFTVKAVNLLPVYGLKFNFAPTLSLFATSQRGMGVTLGVGVWLSCSLAIVCTTLNPITSLLQSWMVKIHRHRGHFTHLPLHDQRRIAADSTYTIFVHPCAGPSIPIVVSDCTTVTDLRQLLVAKGVPRELAQSVSLALPCNLFRYLNGTQSMREPGVGALAHVCMTVTIPGGSHFSVGACTSHQCPARSADPRCQASVTQAMELAHQRVQARLAPPRGPADPVAGPSNARDDVPSHLARNANHHANEGMEVDGPVEYLDPDSMDALDGADDDIPGQPPNGFPRPPSPLDSESSLRSLRRRDMDQQIQTNAVAKHSVMDMRPMKCLSSSPNKETGKHIMRLAAWWPIAASAHTL